MVQDDIFKHHGGTFGDLLILAELTIAMEWASFTVERGFSTINRMLTNTRLVQSKIRLNNFLLLGITVPVLKKLDPNYESKLVDKTIDLQLNKQKLYHSIKSNASTSKSLPSGLTEKKDLFLPTDDDSGKKLTEDDITISRYLFVFEFNSLPIKIWNLYF